MKTSVKITGTGEAKNRALRFIKNSMNSDELLKEIGSVAVEQIQGRTRGRLEEYAQPEITPYTKEQRDRLIRAGNAYDRKIVRSKNTSNLSMSGQLLNALNYRISKATGEITIFLNRARKAYRGIRKEQLENNKDNIEIKNELESRGRKFFFLSTALTAQLENRIAMMLRRQLSLYNKLNRK